MSDSSAENNEIDVVKFVRETVWLIRKVFYGLIGFLSRTLHLFIFLTRKYYLLILLVVLCGVVFNLVQRHRPLEKYESSMGVYVNFGYGEYVYDEIGQINLLIANGNYEVLAEMFSQPVDTVRKMTEVSIHAQRSIEGDLEFYRELAQSQAGLALTDEDKKRFLEQARDYSYPRQVITVYATNKTVFQFLSDGFGKMMQNKRIQMIQNEYILNLESRARNLALLMDSADSLIKIAQRQMASSSPNMNPAYFSREGGMSGESVAVQILNKKAEYLNQLAELNMEILRKKDVLSIYSAFPLYGELVIQMTAVNWFKLLTSWLIWGYLISFGVYFIIYLFRFERRQGKDIKEGQSKSNKIRS